MDNSQAKTILIIDDDLPVRFALRKLLNSYLREYSIKVFTSGNGVDGLGLVYTHKPDLIILDTTLPRYGGREVVDYISTNFQLDKTPVIVLSDQKGFLDFKGHIQQFSKQERNFSHRLVERVVQKLGYPPELATTGGLWRRVLSFLAHGVAKRAGIAATSARHAKKVGTISKLGKLTTKAISELLVNVYLTLLQLVPGRVVIEDNKAQQKKDLHKLRVRYYPTLLLLLVVLVLILIPTTILVQRVVYIASGGGKPLFAATRTWDGGGANSNWSTCTNWSADACPLQGDIVIFDHTSVRDSVVDAGWVAANGGHHDVATISINPGYTGTISLGTSLQVTATFTQAAGEFNAANQTLDIDSTFTLSAGSFIASDQTTFLGGALKVSGTAKFDAHGGTIVFDGESASLACNNVIFNSVAINPATGSAIKTIGSDCILPLGPGPTVPAISVAGKLTGSGTLTTSGDLTVEATADLSGFNGLLVPGAFTVNGANLDLSTYTSLKVVGTTVVNSGSLALPVGADLAGLAVSGGTFTAPAGSISISADLDIATAATFNANGGRLEFTGSKATLACGNASFSQVVFSGSGGTNVIGNDCILPVGANPDLGGNDFVLNGVLNGAGTLSKSAGLLTLNSGAALSGFNGLAIAGLKVVGMDANFSGYSAFGATDKVTLDSGSLSLPVGARLDSALIVQSGMFTAPNGLLSLGGDLTISNTSTFNTGSGVIEFNGGDATLACSNSKFNLVTFTNIETKTVNSDCILPIGNNPVVTNNNIILNGTLSGSGVFTKTSGLLALNTGAQLAGFSAMAVNQLSVAGATLNMGNFPPLVAAGAVTVSAGSLILPSQADINGNLTVSGGTFTAPSGTLTLAGSLAISGTSTFNANGGTIVFDGTSTITIDCNNNAFHTVLFAATGGGRTVNESCDLPIGANPNSYGGLILSGRLSGSGKLTVPGNLTLKSGAVLSGFDGLSVEGPNSTLTVAGTAADFSNYTSLVVNGGTVLNSGALNLPIGADLNGALTIEGGTFSAPSGVISIAGSLIISGSPTFNANGGTIVFDGGTATLTCHNVVFGSVLINAVPASGVKTVGSDCQLPLGSDPTTSAIVLKGKLSGSGVFTNSDSLSMLGSEAALSGFSGLVVGTEFKMDAGSTFDASTYTVFDVNLFTLGAEGDAIFAAPNLMHIGGASSSGIAFKMSPGSTFNANGGTVVLDGPDQTVAGGTFHNLTKIVSSPATLTFTAASTHTVLGALTLKGAAGAVLNLASSAPGSQWTLDPQGTLDLEYLQVGDSNNIAAKFIQTLNKHIANGGNNSKWNFSYPVVSNLSVAAAASGIWAKTATPSLNFKVTDPDAAGSIKYHIKIDNNSDFSSPEVDATSEFTAQGDFTFVPPVLATGHYDWRVWGIDAAGEGDFAQTELGVDVAPPTGFVVINEHAPNTDSRIVALRIFGEDLGSGINGMLVSQSSSFAGANIEPLMEQKSFMLSPGAGEKKVYVKFIDVAGNESDVYSDSITYMSAIDSTLQPEGGPDTSGPPAELAQVSFKIRLVDGSSNPLPNVQVGLYDLGISAFTNADGFVEFADVPAGDHLVLGVYNDKEFEQTINANGSVGQYRIVLELADFDNAIYVILAIGVLLVIIGMGYIGLKPREKKPTVGNL